MPVARPEPLDTRVIAHVDLDCFYVQVEQRRNPELRGKPTAVVQYNAWKGGGIIAVGYEARSAGVSRNMRGDDARKVCPGINLVQVPVSHDKADLTIYRDAGSEVVAVLSRKSICERASIDEVYLDITEAARELLKSPVEVLACGEVLKTHIVGPAKDGEDETKVKEWLCRKEASVSDQLLACGAMVVAELRMAVLLETQFTCSAGIAHNKMLAKLGSGLHKPAQQTLVPSSEVSSLLAPLPFKKIGQLGGKLGRALEGELGIKTMGELLQFSEGKLQELHGFNTGTWLWRIARGICGDEVQGRILPKSHGCGKTFPGPKALKDFASVDFWLGELSEELQGRLELDLQLNSRVARLLVCHFSCHLPWKRSDQSGKNFPSKSCAIRYGKDKIAADAQRLFRRALSNFCPVTPSLSPTKEESKAQSKWAVTAISVSATNIVATPQGMTPITQFFGAPLRVGDAMTATTPVLSPPSGSLGTAPSVASLISGEIGQLVSHGIEGFEEDGHAKPLRLSYMKAEEPDESGWTLAECASRHDVQERIAVSASECSLSGTMRTSCNVLHGSPSQFCGPTMDEETSKLCQEHDNSEGSSLSLPSVSLTCFENGEAINISGKRNRVSSRPSKEFGSAFGNLRSPHLMPSECVQLSVEVPHNCVGVSENGKNGEDKAEMFIGNSEMCKAQPEVILCSPLDYNPFYGVGLEVGRDERCDPDEQCQLTESDNQQSTILHGTSRQGTGSSFKTVAEDELTYPTHEQGLNYTKHQTLLPDPLIHTTQPYKSAPPSGKASKRHFRRLDDMWEKSKPSPQSKLEMLGHQAGYRQEDIDEEVLSELPKEIQEELRNSLGLKKPCTVKRSTITHFFNTRSK